MNYVIKHMLGLSNTAFMVIGAILFALKANLLIEIDKWLLLGIGLLLITFIFSLMYEYNTIDLLRHANKGLKKQVEQLKLALLIEKNKHKY